MTIIDRLTEWLETRFSSPSYSGLLLAGIALCLFGAATNTMAGWLYVISGTIFALLVLGAILPGRSLRQIKVNRLPISPVSAGEQLTIELEIENTTSKAKTLLQAKDILPYVLSEPESMAIEAIAPNRVYRWAYNCEVKKRGVYRWHEVQLKSGAPLGLFWCRRDRQVAAKAIVYPTVLPLTQCPLIDSIGRDDSTVFERDNRYQLASVGLTRGIRPYRLGDPMRLIHWRTSARFGEFKVRELEIITGGQEVVICLDNAFKWEEESFELAVIAAASLYFYARRCQLNVKLWIGTAGLIEGDRVILESLAAINPEEDTTKVNIPSLPLIWLTQNSSSFSSLPAGSRWLFFTPIATNEIPTSVNTNLPGLAIDSKEKLEKQLQRHLN
ncbi:MAG: DUF58 domain-containing protein [Prochloraceae cyanobacterium]|nr:DUF58 domain-containing protein [Prochloraceae cyanobacterium]